MKILFKVLEKISKILKKLIPLYYKKNHKFLNKNQVSNAYVILSLLKDKIQPKIIIDVGCRHGR